MKTTSSTINTYRFKPKPYGIGYFPISWEGWLMTFGFVGIIVLIGYANYIFWPGSVYPNGQDIAMFIAELITITILRSLLAQKRCSGSFGWRWGNK